MRRALFVLATLALTAPSQAFARGEFDPTHEFELDPWVSIHIGPLDMSINKAVVYLMIGSVVTMALGIFLMRARVGVKPGTRQTIGEQIYEVAQTQIAEQGLPHKAIARNIIPKAATPEATRSPFARSRTRRTENAWLPAHRVAASAQASMRQPAMR